MKTHALLACTLALAACVSRIERKVGTTLETVDMKAPYLKVHMRNGDLYVLERWTIDEPSQSVTGSGELTGSDRTTIVKQSFRIRFRDVALYETNTVITSPAVAAMAVITGLSVAVSVACLANPKACFGSCPTFYVTGDDGRRILQAEGFSDSIAPSLERHDIDALWATTGKAGAVTVTMTNEAYETHVIKQADVLAVARPPGGRVLSDGEQLWLASSVTAPLGCRATEGDCLAALARADGTERFSLTDGADLASRETIELAFAPASGDTALVIGARQSLVTTFLLYQGLAYLGTTATSWLAQFERSAKPANGRALQALVGGIEVQLERAGTWVTVGEVYETGPLATDFHMVRLPPGTTGKRVRLRLQRGGWRIDHVALATITGAAQPIRIAPASMTGRMSPDFGRGRAPATAFPIVTQPGDTYDFTYQLPAGEHYELFLDSRGYYLEWMRKEWLNETQPLAALKMLLDPAQALRDLAPAFKQLEPQAEALFWSSRYAHP
ncbi:MAG: hypothetical protein ABI867_45470 [Kofleriaceae bacterium]